MTFGELVQAATGFDPYPYQQQLADEGLAALLRAPTGSGKTVAAILPWLYRRRFHPEDDVRRRTPHWLVLALPLRTLVDQVERDIEAWLERLELTSEVGLHVLLGGRTQEAGGWTSHPERDAILVGSIDMLLSRAMNRGYAANRYRWPLDFGMVNNGAQWVFDEVQLMGPALPTSRQLQTFREALGTTLPTRSMWMSATVSPDWMKTIDAPTVESTIEISDDDRTGPLGIRTSATRTVRELTDIDPKKATSTAEAVIAEHRPGTRTICMVNTVKSAQELYRRLVKDADTDVVLVHSRFRPADRAAATLAALDDDLPTEGRIVVTTQAFEAGVDVSSSTLITEASPWTSMVQRAGRCNRYGEADNARLLWYEPVKAAPYDDEMVKRAIATLRELEGQRLTGEQLANQALEERPLHPVLRRRDLVELFDTTPTLSGDDIDISPYIRDGEDRDVFVGWRTVDPDGPEDDWQLAPFELCRAPVADVRKWVQDLRIKNAARLWRYDPEVGRWARLREPDLHPGMTVLAAARAGHYTSTAGWDPKAKTKVPEVDTRTSLLDAATDTATGDDHLARLGVWVSLPVHLRDTKDRAGQLLAELAPLLPDDLHDAVTAAAALHDVGKVHPVFQETLRESAGDDERPLPDMVWAKSSQQKRRRHDRRHFRHELVSAMMLSSEAARSVLPVEGDLTRYLVAAHHGIVRLGIRPMAADHDPDGLDRTVALGVIDDEEVPGCELHDGTELPPTTMPVSAAVAMGGEGSWTRTTLRLRDREDLGPFRLAWLEAIVRLADWLASEHPSATVTVPVVSSDTIMEGGK